ncbi:unnamed protein product [Oppiella nova]|uniref:Uncharacterized protein n=1 Tax=Oppiella nova TaxID=334625 RepID=A0A7R9LXY8_9ACAR|nr:unnamed protein product [Oppiella nova]CAG2167966.1 unnamed protein product [Oppiella nova]
MSGLGQQYCLKWNNHTNNMVKVFNQLLDDQNFCDVTLAVDGAHLKCHKLVLSACSSYFKELFVSNPCKHPIVILKDMRLDDIKAIVNFMYSGEVNVSQNQLAALLKTAEVLRVKGLTEVNDKQTDALSVPNTTATSASAVANKTPLETPVTQQTPNNSSAGCATRKKRRRRGNHTTNNNVSVSGESGNSSQSDDSSDETSNKKPKESSPAIDATPARVVKESRSLLSESNATKTVTKTPDTQPVNVIQTRRRQTLQNLESEVSRDNEGSEPSIDCSEQHVNNGNQLESWPSGADHSTALALTTAETEDESNDMFDVKPIISFDESPTQGSSPLPEDSSVMISSPSDTNTSAGTSAAQTGKICVCHLCHLTFTAYSSLRRHMARHYADRERYDVEKTIKSKRRSSLRSFGFQSIHDFGYTDSRSECPFCHKRIVNLRRHINEVHVGVLFQCQICCRKFKRKDKLNHHLITEHNI